MDNRRHESRYFFLTNLVFIVDKIFPAHINSFLIRFCTQQFPLDISMGFILESDLVKFNAALLVQYIKRYNVNI